MSPADATGEAVPGPHEPKGAILRAVNLRKGYASPNAGGSPLHLFQDLCLEVRVGESVALLGRSGSGKSSLLHLLAGLDRPTSGQVWIGGEEISSLPTGAAARIRNRDLGFVWQLHYLLPEFSALENVALPLLARGERRRSALAQAAHWLQAVELGPRAHHRSGELSGGEQGRVALARALVTQPRLLLADEPTGDLDDLTAEHMFTLLEHLCRQNRMAVLLVTHNEELSRRCDRTLRLQNGSLIPA